MCDIKALFLDFDWTLFDHNIHDYHYEVFEALQKLKEKGIKLFINSARAFYSLKMLKLFDLISFDGYGCINGLYCLTNEKLLYGHYINQDYLTKIIDICHKNHKSYLLTTTKDTYIKDYKDDLSNDFYQTVCEPYPKDISLYNKKDKILAIQVYILSDEEDLFIQFKDKLRFNRWHPNVIEFNDIESSKKEATLALMKKFHLTSDECMAIGDDKNDIGMFESVKYSVCMGNGTEEVKNKVYYVTSNIDDGGLINALKHFKLL